jgi:excisionase family DNA binding protein
MKNAHDMANKQMKDEQTTQATNNYWFTPEEVARGVRTSLGTVYRYLCSGKLPATKIGRRWSIKEEAIQDLWHGSFDLGPKCFPRRPDIRYRDAGWVSWDHFLGVTKERER